MNNETWYKMMATLLAQKNIHDVTRIDVIAAARVIATIKDVGMRGADAKS